MLISSTSGVSAVIGPDGTVRMSLGLFTAGYMTPTVPLISATTPGTVVGGALEWVVTASGLLAVAGSILLDRRRRKVRSRGISERVPTDAAVET